MNRTFLLDLQKLLWLKFSLWETQIQHSQMVAFSSYSSKPNGLVTGRHQANPPDLKMTLFFIQRKQSRPWRGEFLCLLSILSVLRSCLLKDPNPLSHQAPGPPASEGQAGQVEGGAVHEGHGGNERGRGSSRHHGWSLGGQGECRGAKKGTAEETEGKERARRRGQRSSVVLGRGEAPRKGTWSSRHENCPLLMSSNLSGFTPPLCAKAFPSLLSSRLSLVLLPGSLTRAGRTCCATTQMHVRPRIRLFFICLLPAEYRQRRRRLKDINNCRTARSIC